MVTGVGDISDSRPIGIFDSGVGGLTVVSAIMQHFPQENIIYFGDTARLPYGTKSQNTIKRFAQETVKFLLTKNVKAIVIACNTISAIALDEIKALAGNIPVLDIITPGSKAAIKTNSTHIGIIATIATVNSQSYVKALTATNSNIHVTQVPCNMFVPMIEDGLINHPALNLIAQDYLKPLIDNQVDTIILGCTHYPIIKNTIQNIVGANIKIINPATQLALDLHNIINNKANLNHNTQEQYQCYLTEISPNFNHINHLVVDGIFSDPKLVSI